jgi:hypothetical protein
MQSVQEGWKSWKCMDRSTEITEGKRPVGERRPRWNDGV